MTASVQLVNDDDDDDDGASRSAPDIDIKQISSQRLKIIIKKKKKK